MKILVIRIQHLASLEGVTEIDFTREPLKSAGIFSITGPTGAGKSTILDALCLALYAKTPRYAQATENINIQDVGGAGINQKDVRSILRDGTGEGSATVEFLGNDGHHYKATWQVRRAGGKPEGKLQADTMLLEDLTAKRIIPGKKKEILEEIEQRVGLSFEQFTRSVLLAQGDFTAFLKAGKDEKASLLEKLTGISVYSDISTLVFEKHKQAIQEISLLKQEIEGVRLLEHDVLLSLHEQQHATKASIANGIQQLAVWRRESEWWVTLHTLKENTRQALQDWNQALHTWQQAEEQNNNLALVEAVQKTRGWTENIRDLNQQEHINNEELRTFTKTLEELDSQKLALQQELYIAEQTLEDAKKQETAAEPLLEKARELDVLLKERKQQLDHKTKELDTLRQRSKQLSAQLLQTEKTAAELSSTRSTLEKWLETNQQREAVADNLHFIVSKLEDIGHLYLELKQKEEAAFREQKRVQSIKKEKHTLEKEQQQINQNIAAFSERWQQLQTEIQETGEEALKQAIVDNDRAIETLQDATGVWSHLNRLSEEYMLLQQKLADSLSLQKENEEKLLKQYEELKTAEVQKQTSGQLLKNALIQAAGNVEQLRETLVEGEPCPVCGNTTHPYTHQHPVLDNVLQSLENTHAAHEKEYNDGLQTISRLEQELRGLTASITESRNALSGKQQQLATFRDQWSTYIFESSLPRETAVNEWLQEKLKDHRIKKERLQMQLANLHANMKLANECKEQWLAAEKEKAQTDNAVKDADRSISTALETIQRLQEEQEKHQQRLTETAQLLSPFFSANNWMEHWKSDPAVFVNKIKDFAVLWKKNKDDLEKTIREHAVVLAALQKEQAQTDELQYSIRQQASLTHELQTAFDRLAAERKNIFGGQNVQQVVDQLANAVGAALERLNKRKEVKDELQKEALTAKTRLEQLQQLTALQHRQKATYEAQLSDWISHYNQAHKIMLDQAQLSSLLAYTDEWIMNERKTLKETEDSLTRARAALEQQQKMLRLHEEKRMSDKDSETLNQLIHATEETVEQQREQLNELRLQLRQDEENRKRSGNIQQQIAQKQITADNWGRLNELVGSADGKKFRLVAQEYTLDILLSYANLQLSQLSGRYTLQRIANSLSLQVIDQDMGNDIRPIYSLSGGESFLVSLALALGLASISSSQVQVESLFIDEGFGSLDSITLATVMDALERLHNQGRKVGVISHVEEMTERIPVQIRVNRLTSGRSRVTTNSSLL